MAFGIDIVFVFMAAVAVLSLIVGSLVDWDYQPGKERGTLDPDGIQAALLADETLSEEERQWMIEVASLELPRRHLIC